MLIAFEGIDGAGKSTLIATLAEALQRDGKDVVVLREPGSTLLGERLRTLLLDVRTADLDPWAEACLFTAARAELVRVEIAPALARGASVLIDRFVHSTLAYQGYGQGLDPARLRALQRAVLGPVWPARVFWLDLPPEQASERRRAGRAHEAAPDRIEGRGLEYLRRVAAGYRALAANEPEVIQRLDATLAPGDLVAQALCAWPSPP